MATAYTALFNWVYPDIAFPPPADLVTNAIRDSVIELCEEALIYRQELQQILVLGDTSTTTSATAASGATAITVDSISNFSDGDTITVELEDGTKWRGHVSGTPAGSTINLDGALPDDVESGATVTKLVYLYTMTLPSGTAVAKGLKAWLNDNVIEPISEDDLDTEFNNTDFGWVGVNWRTDVKLPTRWYIQDDGTVGLALAPNATGALRILCALKPTRASTSFPTWIYERYVNVIAHGAKAKLMEVPKKPYSDPQLAGYHMGKFHDGVSEARLRSAKSATRAPLRTHTVFGLR